VVALSRRARSGCGVDDHVGTQSSHGVGDARRIAEIAAVFLAVEIQRRDLAEHGQAALQFPADLAAFAEEQDVHAASYCWDTHSR
jgi:hypothetical protein